MSGLAPSVLLAAATAFIRTTSANQHEDAFVKLLLEEVRQLELVHWSLAFIHHVGYWSHWNHYGHYSVWPLPATPSCADLAQFAAERNVLSDRDPVPGDIVLLWEPNAATFVRAAIMAADIAIGTLPTGERAFDCYTVEGNVDATGRLGSGIHLVHRRVVAQRGDRVVRWWDLDARAGGTNAGPPVEFFMGRLVVRRAA